MATSTEVQSQVVSRDRGRSVSFEPHARVILDDESTDQDGPKGPLRLATRRYSVGAPSLNWSKFKGSLSDAFAPLLSPNAPGGNGGVCSTSTKAPTSPKSDPSPSSGSYFPPYGSKEYWMHQMELGDESFMPAPPKRLEVRLPSLTRNKRSSSSRSRNRTVEPPCRSILKDPNDQSRRVKSPDRSSTASTTNTEATSVSPTSPPMPASVGLKSEPVPLRDCCKACSRSCDYGLRPDYVEHWSQAAKRKRLEHEQETTAASSGLAPATIGDIDEGEEDLPLRVGALANSESHIVVDELGCRAVKPDQQPAQNVAGRTTWSIDELSETLPTIDLRTASPTPSERARADTLPPQQPATNKNGSSTAAPTKQVVVKGDKGASLGKRRSNVEHPAAMTNGNKNSNNNNASKGWAGKLGGFVDNQVVGHVPKFA